MIDRVFLLQLLIDNLNVDRYLEIGVFKGDCFLQLNVPRKICVDPHIQISFWNKIKSILRDSNNQNNQYIELTSDRYFDLYHDTLVNEPPQLVFIDGLHTFEQTLQDVLNVLNYLPENGVIVLHDCSPPTEVSATVGTSLEEAEKNWLATHEGGWTGSWCGDTWKVIPFLKDNYPELHVSVLDFDFGLGVVTKKKNFSKKSYSFPSDITSYQQLTYDFLTNDRQNILNLRDFSQLSLVLKEHHIGS